MNVADSEACVIDANIIYYIHDISGVDGFFDTVEKVYNQVIIHEKVYAELSESGKRFVDNKIQYNLWGFFDETKFSDTQKVEYRQLIGEIDSKLSEIDEQRGKLDSMGTGEIYSLPAATVIHAEFVCSNDYSVHEVIEALSLEVYPCGNDELEPRLLVQHKFIQFCALICEKNILERNQVFKGFKIAMRYVKSENKREYDKLTEEFQSLIPATNSSD